MAKDKGPPQTKQEMRDEAERLIQEALARGSVKVTTAKTLIVAKCGHCGTECRVMAEPGEKRAEFKCKGCGRKQLTL
jgi:hypothetical protein